MNFVCCVAAVCEIQFSAMDVSAWTTMKGAAKCDNLCELQNSVNQQSFERVLCFWDILESMPDLVSMDLFPVSHPTCSVLGCLCVCAQ